MYQQNCRMCEFHHKNMKDGNYGYCYMFEKKPKNKCVYFSSIERNKFKYIKTKLKKKKIYESFLT